jgi:O-antigen ligase
MALAFAILLLACRRGGLSVTAPWRLFPLPLAAYLLWCVCSIAWSLSPATSAFRIAEGILTFLYFQSLVFVLGQSCPTVRAVAQIVAFAIAAATIFGLMVNVAVFRTPLYFWINPDVPERPRFTFGYLHPLAAGDILAMGIVASAFTPWKLILKLGAAVAFFVLLILSDSTAARLSVITLLPIAYIMSGSDAVRQIWRMFALAITALILIIAAIAYNPALVESAANPDSRLFTLTGRVQIWKLILDNNLASTPFGYGFEAARFVITPLVGRSYHAHNLYLNVLVETGIIGFLIFLTIPISWFWRVLNQGQIYAGVLFGYILILGMDNPGMFTKQTIMFAFLLSYHLPALFPRQQQQLRLRLASTQNAAA